MQVREPILGVLWAVATALAVYLNLNYLRKKCGVENTCFQIFVTIGSAARTAYALYHERKSHWI